MCGLKAVLNMTSVKLGTCYGLKEVLNMTSVKLGT
jgi:hypothetical protein